MRPDSSVSKLRTREGAEFPFEEIRVKIKRIVGQGSIDRHVIEATKIIGVVDDVLGRTEVDRCG